MSFEYINQHTCTVNASTQREIPHSIFVDKLVVRIYLRHHKPIGGKPASYSKFRHIRAWFWSSDKRVAVRSFGLNSIFIMFNPSLFHSDYNILCSQTDIVRAVVTIVLLAQRQFPDFTLTDAELGHVCLGRFDISRIDLASDFTFKNRNDLENCFRILRRSWNWRFNKKRHDHYASGLYINQKHWHCCIYFKFEEIDANHSDWPQWTKDQMRYVLRIEFRLSRPELRKQNLGRGTDWDAPNVVPDTFDRYAGRLRSNHRQARHEAPNVPLYAFLGKYGATTMGQVTP